MSCERYSRGFDGSLIIETLNRQFKLVYDHNMFIVQGVFPIDTFNLNFEYGKGDVYSVLAGLPEQEVIYSEFTCQNYFKLSNSYLIFVNGQPLQITNEGRVFSTDISDKTLLDYYGPVMDVNERPFEFTFENSEQSARF